ncbi:MAG: hypothetical protein Q8Q87_04180, partial [Candidatus Omnitrophota bacterium]|nr:hypothetical protein [Candidatus Omnitrophota bacterium]
AEVKIERTKDGKGQIAFGAPLIAWDSLTKEEQSDLVAKGYSYLKGQYVEYEVKDNKLAVKVLNTELIKRLSSFIFDKKNSKDYRKEVIKAVFDNVQPSDSNPNIMNELAKKDFWKIVLESRELKTLSPMNLLLAGLSRDFTGKDILDIISEKTISDMYVDIASLKDLKGGAETTFYDGGVKIDLSKDSHIMLRVGYKITSGKVIIDLKNGIGAVGAKIEFVGESAELGGTGDQMILPSEFEAVWSIAASLSGTAKDGVDVFKFGDSYIVSANVQEKTVAFEVTETLEGWRISASLLSGEGGKTAAKHLGDITILAGADIGKEAADFTTKILREAGMVKPLSKEETTPTLDATAPAARLARGLAEGVANSLGITGFEKAEVLSRLEALFVTYRVDEAKAEEMTNIFKQFFMLPGIKESGRKAEFVTAFAPVFVRMTEAKAVSFIAAVVSAFRDIGVVETKDLASAMIAFAPVFAKIAELHPGNAQKLSTDLITGLREVEKPGMKLLSILVAAAPLLEEIVSKAGPTFLDVAKEIITNLVTIVSNLRLDDQYKIEILDALMLLAKEIVVAEGVSGVISKVGEFVDAVKRGIETFETAKMADMYKAAVIIELAKQVFALAPTNKVIMDKVASLDLGAIFKSPDIQENF